MDGSGTLTGDADGPARLFAGATFGMGMSQQGLRYRSRNEVVEFEENRLICWQTFGKIAGHRIVGGQKWRYELIEEPGGTLVRATYDWSEAMAGRLTVEATGFPARSKAALQASLDRLARMV